MATVIAGRQAPSMAAEPVLTVAQMRAAERAAMDAGVSEWELMRRAGQGAAEWVWRLAGGRSVTVLCGPGNNGGDGYVIAEALRRRGVDVCVVAPAEPATETARTAKASYAGQVQTALGGREASVMVDCLFGYGLSRGVEGAFAAALAEAAAAHDYRIAIDVPSGVESDTGAQLSDIPQYDCTLALGAWKRAHFLMPAIATMGAQRLVTIGIGIPDHGEALATMPSVSSPAMDAHKYTRGLVAIVAGAMPGAPLLAAQAAMRGGAGYVKLLSEHSHPDAPAELVIESGALGETLADQRIGACLIGPGLGRDDAARARLCAALAAGKPMVIDADALHLLDPEMLADVDTGRVLLTPHEGELAQLGDAFGIQAEGKVARAQALRDATGANILAKGPDTILAPSTGGLRFFHPGSSWLSVAGSGDVLAGIAAARLAGHGDAARAAIEAVCLHGEAARLAGPAFTAGELASAVRPALETFV